MRVGNGPCSLHRPVLSVLALLSSLSSISAFSMTLAPHDTASFAGLKGCPRVGLGLAAIGRPGYITLGRDDEVGACAERSKEAFKEQSFKVMDRAWESGVRYFDAARSYGLAEQFLSEWLETRAIAPGQVAVGRFLSEWLETRAIAPGDVAVGSKWGYRYTADWRVDNGGEPHEVKDHSVGHLRSQSAETLALLGKHLRLYQIHSATLESGVLADPEVRGELRQLKTSRGVRLGLSLSGVHQAATLRVALACRMEEGNPASPCLFDCVQATYNLMEQSVGEALLEARTEGLEVIVKEAMANGRLLKGPRAGPVADAAAKLGAAADQVCLAAVLAQPFAPLVLSGAATPDQSLAWFWEGVTAELAQPFTPRVLSGAATPNQVASNAGAETLLAEVGNEVLTDLAEKMRMDPKEYWDERSALAWN